MDGGSIPLENGKQEHFAQALASGESQVRAYLMAYGGTQKNAEAHASRLMVENGGAAERVRWLKAENAKNSCRTRADFQALLCRIAFSRPCDASPYNDACEIQIAGGVPHSIFPSKLSAVGLSMKMNGWEKPSEAEPDGDAKAAELEAGAAARTAEVLMRLRQRRT